MAMSVNFGNNDLNSFLKNSGNRKKAKNIQLDFASMGRIRDAVIQQKRSGQLVSIEVKFILKLKTKLENLILNGIGDNQLKKKF